MLHPSFCYMYTYCSDYCHSMEGGGMKSSCKLKQMVITANVEKSTELFDKVKYTRFTGMKSCKILDAYYL